MTISLSGAAKQWGVPKGTISKAIQNGALAASKNAKGGYDIDVAEFERWFTTTYRKRGSQNDNRREQPPQVDHERLLLEVRLQAAQERLDDANRTIEDLRREKAEAVADLRQERDDWKAQARAAVSAIEDKRQKQAANSTQEPRGWFRRLLGG